MLIANIKGFFKNIFKLFKRKKAPYITVYTDEIPDELNKDTIYIIGENNHLWYSVMLCPCGCNERVQLSLHKEGRPRWYLSKNANGTVSLKPSIWRTKGCRSHYFFENGYIRWCKDES
jgi:hypothetical protein